MRSTPSSISASRFAGDAFAVERARAQAALAQRIVDDADAVGEQLAAPILSCRKLVLRAIEAPLTALARCETSEPATRGSNTTGTLRVVTLRGLSRATARSPALRPIFSGAFQIGGVQRRASNRSRAPCRCLRRRSPSSTCRGCEPR